MKSSVLLLIGATALGFTGCLDKASSAGPSTARYAKSTATAPNGPLWRFHFIGMTELNKGTNVSKLKEIWSLPASQELKKQALDKIAKTPFQLWQKSLPSGTIDQAALIRPLLDDFINSESYVDVQGPASNYDSVIALRLDSDRAKLWETNIWQLVSAWKLPKPQALTGGIPGWEARAKGVTVQLRRRGNWLLTGWSLGKMGAINSLATALEQSERPIPALTSSFLELQADLPSLGRWSPILAKHQLTPVHLLVFPHGEYVRTEARLLPREPLAWRPEAWRIPTNLISEPLVSFSIARGIEPLVKRMPGFSALGLTQTPSQLCGWSQERTAFSTYWALPVDHASNVLRQIAPRVPGFLKRYFEDPPGELVYVTNRAELQWRGMPIVVPRVNATSGGGIEYLIVSLMPLPPSLNPPPAALLAQIKGRNDLAYYEWEITQHRLLQSRRLYQLSDIAHLRQAPGDLSLKWSDEAAPRLGNTVTEVTVSSPRELKLVRKSHLGFTGFELATIMRWIDSPAFPLGYEPPAFVRTKKPGTIPTPEKKQH